MEAREGSARGQDHWGKALDIAIRLSVIAFIVWSSFLIFSPFVVAVVWGALIAITVYPVFTKLKKKMGNRNKLAGTVFALMVLIVVSVPVVLLTDSLIDGAVAAIHRIREGTVAIPPPRESVRDWPVIGESLYNAWASASSDMAATAEKLAPQLSGLGAKLANVFAGLASTGVHTLIALVIAGILVMSSPSRYSNVYVIARRLAGEGGPQIVDLAVDTIRSVVKGVILVALIQGLLAALGLAVAGVPGVGLWALLVTVVAIIQLPPLLVLAPLCVYVFQNNSVVIASAFTIWSVLVSLSDSFLKPMLLGRGLQVPMLVILIGAIGGMLRSGVVGLFIGPVILAIGYALFTAWIAEGGTKEDLRTEPATSATDGNP